MKTDEKVFRICMCLNRTFTREEWWAFLDSEEGKKEIAASFFGFNYNYCDVCLNPNMPIIINKEDLCIIITTSKVDTGEWIYGYKAGSPSNGKNSPCSYRGQMYHTEKEAIYAALCEVESFSQELDYSTEVMHALGVKKEYFNPMQLELF